MSLAFSLPRRPALDRRLVLVGLLLAAVAFVFWTGSRYPSLDDKALMGGDAVVEGLAFDVVVPVEPDAPALVRVGANAVNWAWTNKQGMTFGVLFAALVLTLLGALARRSFEGRFANTLLGVAMGAPLGVCVNCAVPVAESLHRGGARGETTVAALLSSPTLNVVVLSMTFALLPMWVAGLRIGLTLAFIVVGVPLLVRWLWGTVPAPDTLDPAPGPDLPPSPAVGGLGAGPVPATWAGAAAWTVQAVGRNLWYVVRTTVPLMLLAGLLGAIVVTLLPWEALVDVLPDLPRAGLSARVLVAMVGLALLGTFLPVPIAFDVVTCVVLVAAGVPLPYVAVLLVTLGLYSAYPALQIWKTMSRGAALGLFVGVAGLGVLAGVTSVYLAQEVEWRQTEALAGLLLSEDVGLRERPAFPTEGLTAADVARRAGAAPSAALLDGPWPQGVTVARARLDAPEVAAPRLAFARVPGPDLGLRAPDNGSVERQIETLGYNRSAAAGDVNGDGWPDLVFTSEAGVELWASVPDGAGGRRFVRQAVEVPALESAYVLTAALADLDGDAAPDLVVTTFRGGEHVVYNDGGAFTAAGHRALPGSGRTTAHALAFGDVDRDGDLDVVVGRASGFNTHASRGGSQESASFPDAQNVLLSNGGSRGAFAAHDLEGVDGETLSVLLSDLDRDGDLDLVVGNDFAPPDAFYTNDGAGRFRLLTRADGRVPVSATTTMSVASADLDNDLMPEVFIAQVSWARGQRAELSPQVLCRDVPARERRACEWAYQRQQAATRAGSRRTLGECRDFASPADRADCAVLYERSRIREAYRSYELHRAPRLRDDDPDACRRLATSGRWPQISALCEQSGHTPPLMSAADLAAAIPSRRSANVLLRRQPSGAYADSGEESGMASTAWTWNARFADLDHDGLQDLAVVNGLMFNRVNDHDFLFRNVGGGRFQDVTEAAGFGSWLDTFAYAYVDIDRDGDLDVVSPSAVGPVTVYRNETAAPSVQVALRDDATANRFGVGAVVTARFADGTAQMREVQLGGGFASFDEPVAHFGLGAQREVAAFEVRWPTGETVRLEGPFAAGARYEVRRARR